MPRHPPFTSNTIPTCSHGTRASRLLCGADFGYSTTLWKDSIPQQSAELWATLTLLGTGDNMHKAKTRAFYMSYSKTGPLQSAGTHFDRKGVALRTLVASTCSICSGQPFGALSALATCVITSQIHLRTCLHKCYWSWNWASLNCLVWELLKAAYLHTG